MTTYSDKPKRGALDFELADLSTRLIAIIIDGVILGIITGLLVSSSRDAGGFASFVIGVIYQWYFLTQQNGRLPASASWAFV